MKQLLALLLLPVLLQTKKSFGQDSLSRLAVVVSPALFVPVSVAMQGGISYRFNSRCSFLLETAIPLFHPANTEYEKISYWRTGLEVQYAYRRKTAMHRYMALQLTYLFRELVDDGQAFYYTKTKTFSYTNAAIQSPVLGTAIKTGVQISAGKKFFVDAFVGGGLRFIFTSYETKNPLVTSLEPKKQTLLQFDDAWLYNYTLKRLHATAGLRLGIRL
ncbi:MAG TPA: hypothetical protein VM871_05465 [Flavisolibacter sp.]|jgi:hypothetical protein|nr:hypothetical protein [Flavisolibacter sp.]